MAASLTRYCLDELSDYEEFERLCHSLLILEGYPLLEPLGGYQDKGRDAIHNCTTTGISTVFAYSVRDDWQVKLAQDAKKVHEHNHKCDVLFFLTTAKISATQRDVAVEKIGEQYGWKLEIREMEWFSAILDAKHSHLKTKYPSIFPPEFLEVDKGLADKERSKYIYISFSSAYQVLAKWLAQKLIVEGYDIWSPQLGLPKDASPFEDFETIIRERCCCLIGLYSASIENEPELIIQRSLAISIGKQRNTNFFIPLCVEDSSFQAITTMISPIKPILFANWAQGWQELIQQVEKTGCACDLPTGKVSASRVNFADESFLNFKKTSLVVSNCLKIVKIPQTIYRYRLSSEIADRDLSDYKEQWAFRLNRNEILSFQPPPENVRSILNIEGTQPIVWTKDSKISGSPAGYVISELLRKAIFIKCYQKGLKYCSETDLQYFPQNLVKNNNLRFIKLDGTKSRVQCCGEQKYWKPSGSERFCYFLAPSFKIRQDLFDQFSLVLTIRYRLTDTEGNPLAGREIASRRKRLCQNWWNHHWLYRTLAVFQFLADEDGFISTGKSPQHTIAVQSEPLIFQTSVSVNQSLFDEFKKGRKEVLDTMYDDDGEEEV
ncbi:toll/interleukin-1 receptor domain-containing protein [Nodosilinea sp. FACHB-131]|uniref:TIR domain-containing protein n=1 Tax=Cyanophyceae TaxID=3028117 RepID=UPI0016884E84|nr:TIR domain-containing protein [Nodosilinea sp. FACHB-131]MBD1877124.1 toll/interleukin-1 receptor domain-containing protein [Nodosilinea sp. FACHB-131]